MLTERTQEILDGENKGKTLSERVPGGPRNTRHQTEMLWEPLSLLPTCVNDL